MSETVKHPIFARVYHWMSTKAEEAGEAEHRRELLTGLHGRVLELGAGNGLHFEEYAATVEEVVAVEPEAYLRERAIEAAREANGRVDVVDGLAGQLAFKHQQFDAAVVSSVLCTVPDVDAALTDLRRLIRPGGELRFYEHVLAPEPRLAALQRALIRSGVWPLIGGGCHADRDTASAIQRSGFDIENCRRFDFRPTPLVAPAAPRILGTARRPQEDPG